MGDKCCGFSLSLKNNKAINKALQEEKELMEKLKNQLKLNNVKELIIKPEEGYEVDKEKSTFERIVFKKKDGRVRKWEELGKVGGFYIDYNSEIYEGEHDSFNNNKNIFPTKQDAESALALSELLQYRQQWINDNDPNWKPFWDGGTENWCIHRLESDICVNYFYSQFYELSFPTQEMAEDFRRTFNELLRVYFKV